MKFLSPHPVNIPRAWPHYGWVQKSGSEAQQKDGEESAGCHGNAVQAAWFYQQGARVFCLSCRNPRQFISTARRRLWREGRETAVPHRPWAGRPGAGTLWRTRPRSAGDTPGSKATTQSRSCKGYSMAAPPRGSVPPSCPMTCTRPSLLCNAWSPPVPLRLHMPNAPLCPCSQSPGGFN